MIVLGKFRKLHRIIAVALVAALFVTSGFFAPKSGKEVEANIDVASRVGNPVRANNVTTWDCVYFGHYKQTLNKEYDGTNDEYFREPIKWRVLEEKDGQLLLMSDQSLESIQYNQDTDKMNPDSGKADVSWANSDLRAWLNDEFYDEAFSSNEKGDIEVSNVTADASRYRPHIDQGPATQDNVYILSMEEALNPNYGFVDNYVSSGDAEGTAGQSNTRCSVNTAYTKRLHMNKKGILGFNDGVENKKDKPWICGEVLSGTYGGFKDTGIWWLRTIKSVTKTPYYMYRVDYDGVIKEKPCAENNACVRPVIRVNEDSEYLKYAGTISSNGEETDYCGDNVKSSFDLATNTLRIYGSGSMYDFDDFEAPWHKYCEQIYTVVVDEQVTNVSKNAFEDCELISYMYLNENVTEFSDKAFSSVADDLLISVEKDSEAEELVADNKLNYTNIRSKKPLAVEINDIYGIKHEGNRVEFSFDNPMPGQSYEVTVDKNYYTTIENCTDSIVTITVDDLTENRHVIRVVPKVIGSNGHVYKRAGKVVRVNDEGYSNPWWEDKKNEKSHWDCVYFGSYPQSEDADGDWTEDGKTYKREPIMWKILASEDNTMLLMADKSIDNKQFNTKSNNSVKWETCSLRSWLNDDTENENIEDQGFITRAFNDNEQAALVESTTAENTQDKVFLLSRAQAEKEEYGFLADPKKTKTRRSNATDYAGRKNDPTRVWPTYVDLATWRDNGKPIYDTSETYYKRATIWWLIDKTGKDSKYHRRVNYPGNTDEGKETNGDNACVKPVIRVKANSSAIQDAGSIDSYGNYTPPAKKYSIKIDGHVVKTVKEGSDYTLPENQSVLMRKRNAENGEHLGYIDLESTDDVYREGTTFHIDRDREFETINSVDIQHGGAGVRVSKSRPRGLAFRSVVTINDKDPYHTKAFQYGVLATTYDDWYDFYDQNIEPDTEEIPGHRLYNVLFGKNDFVKNSPQYFTVAINNLKKANNARQFVVKPYVLIHYANNGGTEVVYSSEPYTMCSAAQSATNIMADTSKWPTAYAAWQRDIIEYYLTTE